MNFRKRDISDIRLGVAFRSRLEHDPGGDISVVQAKDINDDGGLDLAGVFRVAQFRFNPAQRLRPGDVLLQTRGLRYRATFVDIDLQAAVAAAPLYVIRPTPGVIDPGYLVQFLNSPLTQLRMRQRATGTYVPQLPRAEIHNLEIPLPPMAEQQQLVELGQLIHHERKLAEELADRRSKALWAMMWRAAEKRTQRRGNASGP